MAIVSQIRQLQTPDNQTDVYPLTLEDAVFDGNGVQLSTKMTAISGSIASISGQVSRNSGSILSISGQMAAMSGSIASISGRMDTTQADIAPVEPTTISSAAYTTGDYLIQGNQLYRTTSDIPIGGIIAPGTNVTPVRIVDEMGSGSGGHEILDASGNALAQEPALQFAGMNVEDDSVNGKTIVHGQIKKVTQAQYDALSAAEKADPNTTYEITDTDTVLSLPSAILTISSTGWSNSTTTVDGTAYYTHETALSSVFDSHPDIQLGALGTVPTSTEKTAFNAVYYFRVDTSANKLICYATTKPNANFVIVVKGVSV